MKTKIYNIKLVTFIGMFLIFSGLAIYAYSGNNTQIAASATEEEESIIIDSDNGLYFGHTLKIYRSLCVNCGTGDCIGVAPDYLEIRYDNKVGKKANVTSMPSSIAEELEATCPMGVFEILYE